jgi:hypothetical protein
MIPNLRSFLPSVLRTFVPILVGYFAAWPVAQFLNLTDDQVTSLVTTVVAGLYWITVRVLETYVLPQAGWLLGWAAPPVYVDPSQVRSGTSPAQDVAAVLRG